MVSDRLSEVFDLVEVRGVVSGGLAARGPWISRVDVRIPLKFVAVVCGRARLTTDGIDAPVRLDPGDVAILHDRAWMELEGGRSDGPRREILPEEDFSSARIVGADRERDDVIVGGRIDVTPAGRSLLLNVLPPVAHIRASTADSSSLRRSLHRLFDEVTERKLGAAFAIRQHGQLLLLEVLRAYAQGTDLPPGWLGVLRDEQLRPALDLMHDHPEQPWGLRDLAEATAMSRTSFAERFREAAGVPPLTYLNRWRMLLAQRALRDGDIQISALAADLGYASDGAFSTAFKRLVGESPLRYRQGVRASSTSRA